MQNTVKLWHMNCVTHELCVCVFPCILIIEKMWDSKILCPVSLSRAEVSRSLEEPTLERIEEVFAESADA